MLFKWWRARKERKDKESFERGYAWAMVRFCVYNEPKWYLRDQVHDGMTFDKTAFDYGALAALDFLPDQDDPRFDPTV